MTSSLTSDFMTSSVDADVTPTATSYLPTALTSVREPTSGVPVTQLSAVEEKVFQGVQTALTILALSANCLSLLVMYGVVSQLTPPLRILTSLSFAQMLAPWAIMTIYFSRSTCQDEIHTSVLLASHNAAALTLLARALTHHVASFRPFQYARIASPRRLWASVAVIWVVALALGHVHFMVSLGGDHDHDPSDRGGYCARVADRVGIALSISLSLAFLVILTGLVIYTRILVSLRPVEAFVVDPPVNRSSRGVVNGIALLAGYAIAWVPYLAIRSVVAYRSAAESRVSLLTTGIWQTVIVAGCFVDPVVYGIRMDVLSNGYLKLWRRIRHWAASAWGRCKSRLRCREDDDIPNTPLNQIDAISY